MWTRQRGYLQAILVWASVGKEWGKGVGVVVVSCEMDMEKSTQAVNASLKALSRCSARQQPLRSRPAAPPTSSGQ